VATGRKDVTIIHLNHPLLKRAMGVFRSNLWSQGFGSGPELARAAYRVLPAHLLNVPMLVAFGRAVATSELSQKIHEGLIAVGGEIHQQELTFVEDDLLRDLLKENGVEAALPRDVAKRLQSFFPTHEKQLMALLTQREKDERRRLANLLQKKASEETKAIDTLLRDRVKELEKRLAEREKEAAGYQLSLFGDEAEQFEEDTDWLMRKREHLLAERAAEPERIKQRYALRGVRVFPLGVLYLLPETMM